MTSKTTKLRQQRKSPKSDSTAAPSKKASAASPKGQTKQAQLIDLLQRDQGASTTELASALGWLPHTTRAALTGLRKKGQAVLSEKANGETRYRIEKAA